MELTPATEFLRPVMITCWPTAFARFLEPLAAGLVSCAISICFDNRLVRKLAKAAAAKRKAHAPSTLSSADRTLLRNRAALGEFAHNRETFAIVQRGHPLSSTGVTNSVRDRATIDLTRAGGRPRYPIIATSTRGGLSPLAARPHFSPGRLEVPAKSVHRTGMALSMHASFRLRSASNPGTVASSTRALRTRRA
jgi:hypothetical protein